MKNQITETIPVVRQKRQVRNGRMRLPGLGLRVSERKLLLIAGDLFILNFAFLIYIMARDDFAQTMDKLWDRLPWFVVFSLLWLLMSAFVGTYNLARAADVVQSVLIAGGSAFLVSGVYLLIPIITPSLPERRTFVFLLPILCALGVGLWRIIYAKVFVQPIFRRNLLVVGAGWAGRTLVQAVTEASDEANSEGYGTVYNLLGFVDDDPEKQDKTIAGYPVLGDSARLVDLVEVLEPDELVISITHSQMIHPGLFQAILDCREKGTTISPMAVLYENLTGRVPVEHAGRELQVVIPMTFSAGHRIYMIWRRIFDVLIAIPGCLFLAVLLPLVWLGNIFTNSGDLFYRQKRIGMGGRPFTVIKFRSMVMHAEKETGVVWAAENDSRVTPVGRILRRTRLDEVPQFWNIIKGEMSLIGPRPERPSIVAKLAEDIPFYRVRHAVKPGLTGWAQVKYRYGASVNDALIKLQYDLYYIKYQGIYLDIQIILKTIQVVLGLKGR